MNHNTTLTFSVGSHFLSSPFVALQPNYRRSRPHKQSKQKTCVAHFYVRFDFDLFCWLVIFWIKLNAKEYEKTCCFCVNEIVCCPGRVSFICTSYVRREEVIWDAKRMTESNEFRILVSCVWNEWKKKKEIKTSVLFVADLSHSSRPDERSGNVSFVPFILPHCATMSLCFGI